MRTLTLPGANVKRIVEWDQGKDRSTKKQQKLYAIRVFSWYLNVDY